MQTVLSRATFVGLHVRISAHKGNPCKQPELQHHFVPRYLMVTLTTTADNKHLAAGYWHLKLVYVKTSWNPIVKSFYTDKHAIVIGTDEIITNITYGIDIIKGAPTDVVGLTLKSLEDGFSYLAEVRLAHGAKPLFPMKPSPLNATP